MAKKEKQENVEQPIVLDPEQGENTPESTVNEGANESEGDGSIEENAEVSVVEEDVRMVKVRAAEDIECIIAGVAVSIRNGDEQEVPSDVAAILCYSGKAYRL